MSWVALLLIGVGLADLAHSARPVRFVPEIFGAVALIGLGLAADLTSVRDLAALLVLAAVVLAWGRTVREGFGAERAWLPLALLGTAVLTALALSPLAGTGSGAVGDWLDGNPMSALDGVSVDHALVVLGAVLLQMSTGNVLVRLVLRVTGTIDPARGARHDATRTLKGGRLLGPMERLVILGLGIAGHATAASVVIAAKGLLRFPELQSARDARTEPSIDEVTEYFLVGSFVSWLVALAALVLVAAG
ncbi:MAG: hypothetical protein ACJ716_11550 [Marmoricola sp.]